MDSIRPGTPVEVTIKVGNVDNRTRIMARATSIPGLVANQGDNNTDLWTVTHERSGLSLGWWTTDPELAMRFAHAIASFADWTLSAEDIAASIGNGRKQIDVIGREYGMRRIQNSIGGEARYVDVNG